MEQAKAQYYPLWPTTSIDLSPGSLACCAVGYLLVTTATVLRAKETYSTNSSVLWELDRRGERLMRCGEANFLKPLGSSMTAAMDYRHWYTQPCMQLPDAGVNIAAKVGQTEPNQYPCGTG